MYDQWPARCAPDDSYHAWLSRSNLSATHPRKPSVSDSKRSLSSVQRSSCMTARMPALKVVSYIHRGTSSPPAYRAGSLQIGSSTPRSQIRWLRSERGTEALTGAFPRSISSLICSRRPSNCLMSLSIIVFLRLTLCFVWTCSRFAEDFC